MATTFAIQNSKTGQFLSAAGTWVSDRTSAQEHETSTAALDHWNQIHYVPVSFVPTPDPAPVQTVATSEPVKAEAQPQ